MFSPVLQSLAVFALLALPDLTFAADATQTCSDIKDQISGSSKVLTSILDGLDFESQTHHWYATSSQTPACVVEPATPEDVAVVMRLISTQQTPFAIYSGGHASNPGFSSTTGVHISMTRMNQIVLSTDKTTVEIGMGLTWADVYKQFEANNSGINVVGGRTSGPGVGGFTLGGGYSWKTNQFGLTCDTVKQYNVVLANGTITSASADTNPDLFFALKGGMNRFAVVTSAVFHTHPQEPQIFGGVRLYSNSQVDALMNATYQFGQVSKDPKAQVITTLGTATLVLFFYDGPDAGDEFAMFDDIPSIIDLVGQRSFSDFVGLSASQIQEPLNPRGTFITMSTSALTQGFLAAVQNQSKTISESTLANRGIFISYDVEPFGTYGQYATDSAYPHSDSPLPLNLYFSWALESDDEKWYGIMKDSIATLKQVAIEEGIYKDSFTAYPNYAISGTTAEELYGTANAARLSAIKASVDPNRVMDLAGGFAI